MSCQSCKHWRPTYAPYVKHGYPYIMTCRKDNKDRQEFGDKCKYWESNNENSVGDSSNMGSISDRL